MSASTMLAWLAAGAWQSALVGLALVAAVAFTRSHAARRVLLGGGLLKFLVPAFVTAPFAALGYAGAVAAGPLAPAPAAPPGAAALVLAVWACGVAAGLARLAARHARLRGEIAASPEVTDGALYDEVRAAAAALGLARVPRVHLTADRAAGPRACGVLRPAILLPAGLAGALHADTTRAVLTHELAHHRRRDLALLALADVVAAVWWFHPVAWLLNARTRRAVEEACDDTVLAERAVSRDAYCAGLLAVARFCAGPEPRAAAGFAAHPLRHRLRRIVTGEQGSGGWLAPAFALLLVGLLLPGAPRGVAPGPDGVVRRIEVRTERDVRVRVERPVVRRPGGGDPRRAD